jgi:hypothetical protein
LIGHPPLIRLALGLAALACALAPVPTAGGAATASPTALTIGAYYYPWYGPNGAAWSRGYTRGSLEPPQQPLLGEYASDDPGVIAQHYAWAHRYGVDVFLCSWEGPLGFDDLTIRDHLLPSPARGATRIGILYESIQRLGLSAPNEITIDDRAIGILQSDFDYLAHAYFTQPGYYRVGARPVVVLYVTRIWVGKVAEAVAAIRAQVRAVTGRNPYLIGDEVDPDIGPFPAHIRLFDAITGYTLYSRKQTPGWPSQTGFVARSEKRMQRFQQVARAAGVAFVPGSLPGFDDRALRPGYEYALPHELSPSDSDPASLFSSTLRAAGRLVDPRLRLLTVTSWNEWNEDTQIEPTAPAAPTALPEEITQGYVERSYGFALLEALARFRATWRLPPAPKRRPLHPPPGMATLNSLRARGAGP